MKTSFTNHPILLATAFHFAVLLLLACTTYAAGWRVSPIRLDFDQKVRSGVITIANDGDSGVTLQMKAVVWSQDEQGKDRYEDATDVVFFPRIMTLRAGDSRILRAGIQFPATDSEKTYRLFIEEIPEPKKEAGAVVSLAMRLGIPIFVSPLKVQVANEFSAISYTNAALHVTLKNSGNTHYRVQEIRVGGKDEQGLDLWTATNDGWYLLPGVTRNHSIAISPEDCRRSSSMTITVHSDKGNFSEIFKVDPAQCTP